MLFSGPFGHSDHFDRTRGFLTPWSFVPHHFLTYSDDMTYTQRVYNVILSLYDWWHRSWISTTRQNDIARRYFGHLAGKSGFCRILTLARGCFGAKVPAHISNLPNSSQIYSF